MFDRNGQFVNVKNADICDDTGCRCGSAAIAVRPQIAEIARRTRPAGSFYGEDERDTLLAIAEPVARAIAVARQREEREAERKREMVGIATWLAVVETRLNGEVPMAA